VHSDSDEPGKIVPPYKRATKPGVMVDTVNAEPSSVENGPCSVLNVARKLVIVPLLMKKDPDVKSQVTSQIASALLIVKVTEPGQRVESVPPFTPRAGSTPSARATDDDRPRKITTKNHREMFTSFPPHIKDPYRNLNP
jgi:hypothetical protein